MAAGTMGRRVVPTVTGRDVSVDDGRKPREGDDHGDDRREGGQPWGASEAA